MRRVSPEIAGTDVSGVRRWRDGLLLRLFQVVTPFAVVVAMPFVDYELDRFYVPKELLLHLLASVGLIVLIPTIARAPRLRVEALLVGFLVLGIVSAGFSTNVWLAIRALAITGSGIALFAIGRALREKGLARHALVVVAISVVLGCVTALLQAYGVDSDLFFSPNRAPGGTLGNRNSVAHLAAFGFPVVLLCTLRSWRPIGYLWGVAGILLVTGTLVMTRSRAGWLGFAAAAMVLVISFLLSGPVRRSGRAWLRLVLCIPLAALGVYAAVHLPNDLNWRSDNPYLESVQGIANYQEGSGRGRLVHYRQSLLMSLDHPLLGVGPGNWPVRYPEFAAPGDPSLDRSAAGTTANPWPSSDWVAFVSERGIPATLLLIVAALLMMGTAFQRVIKARDADEGLQSGAFLAVMVGAGVAGMFDAVLLLGLPTLLVWLTLGLLYPPEGLQTTGGAWRSSGGWLMIGLLLTVVGTGVFRSGAQLFSMAAYTKGDSAWMARAAVSDPGNYRLQLRLAGAGGGRSWAVRCEHARAALALFPNARAARNAASGCGE